MKIIINTAHQRFGGAAQVALSFIYECIHFSSHEYHVFVGPGVERSLKKRDFPANFFFYNFSFGSITLWKVWMIQKELGELENRIKPACIISTSGPAYWKTKAPHLIGFNLPLYIYPESPHLQRLSVKKKWIIKLKKFFHYYFFKRDAAAYVVQTDDVNRRVRSALKTNKVFTITNTHNGFYNDWKKFPAKLPDRKEKEIRLITISAWYPHKNLKIIPSIVEELRKKGIVDIKFILTIDQNTYHHHFGDQYLREIVTVGQVKPEECPSLYAECDIMFLPTLAECFSASYPEAMIMEKPIITTDLGFARSICGDAALYYAPLDAKAAAERIVNLIRDMELYTTLQKKGKERLAVFDTPNERARKYLELGEILLHACKN